jgi:hypothetical protein
MHKDNILPVPSFDNGSLNKEAKDKDETVETQKINQDILSRKSAFDIKVTRSTPVNQNEMPSLTSIGIAQG